MTLSAAGGLSIGTTSDAGAGNTLLALNKAHYLYTSSYGIGTGTGLEIFYDAGDVMRFISGGKSGTERMRLDSSGNLGLGVTPNTGWTTFRALQIGAGASVAGHLTTRSEAYLSSNWYYNSGNKFIGSGYAAQYAQSAGVHYWFTSSASGANAGDPVTFTQAMTLTADGRLGIATTSPTSDLSVGDDSTTASRQISLHGPASGTNAGSSINVRNGTNTIFAVGNASNVIGGSYSSDGMIFWGNAALRFYGNGAERARIDSSGNLGLGVTPSAWSSYYRPLQAGTNGAFAGGNDDSVFTSNAYYDGNWKYITSSVAASRLRQTGGTFTFSTAASGTAGNAITFTQAMTLDASGNLLVGTTSVTAGGNGQRVDIRGSLALSAASAVNGAYQELSFPAGDYKKAAIRGYSAGTTDAGELRFYTAPAGDLINERARIDSSGNFLVGTTTVGNGLGSSFRGTFLSVSGGDAVAIKCNGANAANLPLGLHNDATSGNNSFANFYTEASPTSRGSITYNRAGGLTTYNTTSDYRAKDISGNITDSGSVIDSVPVYMGKMKGATQERPMFIAHETPEYAHTGEKDAVDADGNPVYQQMDASALIPVMWAEIQSLRKRLADAGL
jgi:hypothetical protein